MKRTTLSSGLIALLMLAVINVASASVPEKHTLQGFNDILSYQLSNGLTVVLWPDEAAKQISLNLWYRVGSLHEKSGVTGIAHLFEHMMLRPSKYAPQGALAFERTMGAEIGATTRFRTTEFHVTTVPEKLDELLKYQADVMKNLPLDAAMLDSEKEAVRSEYLIWDNSPFMTLLPVLSAHTYPNHIARFFLTGARPDLARISAQDCKQFYASYYAPNNAVLVIAGKLDPSLTISLVENYFGPIPRGKKTTLPQDIQKRPVAALIEKQVPGASRPLVISYPLPFHALPENEDSALDLAFAIAFKGNSSLAGDELINKKKLADSIGFESRGLGFYFVNAFLTSDNATEATKTIDSAVKSIQSINEATFHRYASAAEADTLRSLQTPAQRSNALGYYLTHRNGIKALQDDLEASKRISLSELKRISLKYLSAEHRIAVYGKPTGAQK